MYQVEKLNDGELYTFNGSNLRIKAIEENENVRVYINYNGHNPLFSMLFGNFAEECEIDSISFEVKTEQERSIYNSTYAVVKKADLIGFIKEVYFFVIENNVANKLDDKDKIIWSF